MKKGLTGLTVLQTNLRSCDEVWVLPLGAWAPKLCKSVKAHHWVFLGLSGFRHWLQLVRCTYLLTLSKYFGWGRTFRVGWNPKLAFALKSEVMKLGEFGLWGQLSGGWKAGCWSRTVTGAYSRFMIDYHTMMSGATFILMPKSQGDGHV